MSVIDHYLQKKRFIGLIEDELGGQIMTEFVALRPKTYSYLMEDGSDANKSKRNKEMYNEKNT